MYYITSRAKNRTGGAEALSIKRSVTVGLIKVIKVGASARKEMCISNE